MPEWEVQCFRNSRLVKGVWKPFEGVRVATGRAREVGISMYQNLMGVGGVDGPVALINEVTGDILRRTRKDELAGKFEHYFSKETGILVTAFVKNLIGGHDE